MAHRTLLFAFALSACTDSDSDDDNPTDGSEGPAHFEFNDHVPAADFDSSIEENALVAHQVGNMLLSSTAVVVADEKVQDRLNIEGAGGESLRAAGLDCWAREPYPMFSFPIDYSTCSTYLMDGGVYVADHPTGPLLFEFQNFQISDRTIGGVLAFDRRGAFADPLYWSTYNTDSDNPGLENRVQIGVTVDDGSFGVTWDGGANVNFLTQEWAMWGVMDFAVGTGETVEVVYGGLDPADVPADDPPGADVLKSSLNWLECRCPTSGLSSQSLPLHVESVTFDIDALEMEPDEIDDPTIVVETEYDIVGDAVLTWTGCGSWDVAYTSTAASIPISTALLQGQLSFYCETEAIPDDERCSAMVAAASRLPAELMVDITEAEVTASAKAAADNEFDTTWCQIY
jgi:hypothetical protein